MAGSILKSHEEKQVATKVPIEGEYGKTTIGTWYAVLEVLRNAFIQALYPSIDNEINIHSVNEVKPEEKKGFLKKLFDKSESKNKKDKRK